MALHSLRVWEVTQEGLVVELMRVAPKGAIAVLVTQKVM
jgi:hypothetical protein